MNKVSTRKSTGGLVLQESHLVGAALTDIAALTAYDGTATQLIVLDGRGFRYVSGSTATADTILVVAATGKGSGRWHCTTTNLHVSIWGAKGDSTTDDTAALQAAYTYCIPKGLTAVHSDATYKITSRLYLPFQFVTTGLSGQPLKDYYSSAYAHRWKLIGNNTVMLQDTDNEPIFFIPGENLTNFEIKGFQGKWTTNQPVTFTKARLILQSSTENLLWGINNGQFNELSVTNGYGVFGPDPDCMFTYIPVWGCTFFKVTGGFYQTGEVLDFRGTGVNNSVDHFYVYGFNIEKPAISLSGMHHTTLTNIEINGGRGITEAILAVNCVGLDIKGRNEASNIRANFGCFLNMQGVSGSIQWDTYNTSMDNQYGAYFLSAGNYSRLRTRFSTGANIKGRLWVASTAYRVGDVVANSARNGHRYVCTTAGTSGTSQPSFTTTASTTYADGTVTWQESGTFGYLAGWHLTTNAEIIDEGLTSYSGALITGASDGMDGPYVSYEADTIAATISLSNRLKSATSISSAPVFVGQMAVVSSVGYMAVGVSSTSDWKQITN